MSVEINFSGKTALITGATRGIGHAISNIFTEAGADVILTGTKSGEIEQLNKKEKDPNVKWIHADFSSLEGINFFIEKLKSIDNIDICVNNAGINIIKPYENYTKEEYQRLININLTAPFSLVQNLIPGMKKRGFGRIVNIASIWSELSKPDRTLYTTSKAGMVGFTRALAVEHAASNILVNAVSPGFTLTELTEKSLSSEEMTTLSEQIPLLRFADPNEIANTVMFLSSDLNTYITGQNIFVDGGFTIV